MLGADRRVRVAGGPTLARGLGRVGTGALAIGEVGFERQLLELDSRGGAPLAPARSALAALDEDTIALRAIGAITA